MTTKIEEGPGGGGLCGWTTKKKTFLGLPIKGLRIQGTVVQEAIIRGVHGVSGTLWQIRGVPGTR